MSKSSKSSHFSPFSLAVWPLFSDDPPKPCPKRFLCASWSSVAVDPAAFPTSGTGGTRGTPKVGRWGQSRSDLWGDVAMIHWDGVIPRTPSPPFGLTQRRSPRHVLQKDAGCKVCHEVRTSRSWHRWNVSKMYKECMECVKVTYFRWFIKLVSKNPWLGPWLHRPGRILTPRIVAAIPATRRSSPIVLSENMVSLCIPHSQWFIFFPLERLLGEYTMSSHTYMCWSFFKLYIDGRLTRMGWRHSVIDVRSAYARCSQI